MRRLFLLMTLALASTGGAALPQLPPLPTTPSAAPTPGLPAAPAQPGALPTPTEPATGTVEQAQKNAGDERPNYSGLQRYLFHFPDFRLGALPKGRLPYLSVTDTSLLRAHKENLAACQQARVEKKATDPGKCSKIEWSVPYSTEAASVTAATSMRAAWQRYEDRYYWNAMIELNNPALYLTQCVVDLSSKLRTDAATVRVTVEKGDLPGSKLLEGRVPLSTYDNALHLDSYLPWPQTPKADRCGGVSMNLIPDVPFLYLPGTCFTVFGVPTFCIQGDRTYATNPAAPAPIYFNMGEAQQRVQRAVKRAHSSYFLDYQKDVVSALFDKKNPYFFGLPWKTLTPGDGAVVAPVMNYNVNPKPFTDLARLVQNAFKGKSTQLYSLNSSPYYFQSTWRSPSLSAHLAPGRHDALSSPPGLWAFEEFKRTLPPSNPAYQERMGYTTFFQAFNTLHTATLPEPATAKPLRPITYFATGVVKNFPAGTVVLPQPMLVPPYLAGLPFAAMQAHYDWRSVPEGYQVPRVQGQPLFDYAPLIR
ncbi:hypothetical protein [Deinococcus aestuarii]|uniref:hypothetical protein n=1 Tax=Deinococcus aestuarii TaxID=2774531 RepID=UPI001C0B7FC2|nr:hypothetical protein [Deinococcus aestuarii]